MAELVALCAYHLDRRDAVNQALRGESGGEPELRLAQAAARGLRRLPVVLGPVFAASGPPADYQPGDELVEPAFVDVELVRSAAPSAGVELAIWSTSARRLDSFDRPGSTLAVFPPASRFVVIGVQRPDQGGLRVLLRDQSDGRPVDGPVAGRLIERMSAAVAAPAAPGPARLLPFAPGLDERGHHFTAPRLPRPTLDERSLR